MPRHWQRLQMLRLGRPSQPPSGSRRRQRRQRSAQWEVLVPTAALGALGPNAALEALGLNDALEAPSGFTASLEACRLACRLQVFSSCAHRQQRQQLVGE